MNRMEISVVVPVYNSSLCLGELVNRLKDTLTRLNRNFEVILVNDRSTDNSWLKIEELSHLYPFLIGIDLKKNFGQDCAIMAGLSFARGKSIIVMDDDLQHDPADIPALIAKQEEGYDVCYAQFQSKKQSRTKNFGSWLNDKMANVLIKKPKEVYLSPFKAISATTVKEILKYDGPYPYIDGLLFRVTNNITQIPVEHHSRFAGNGNFGLIRSIRVILRLSTNFSVEPLRLSTLIGALTSVLGFLFGIYLIIEHIVYPNDPIGWASMIVIILFLGGIQLLTIGIIGEYIGRLFIYHSRSPQYVINQVLESNTID